MSQRPRNSGAGRAARRPVMMAPASQDLVDTFFTKGLPPPGSDYLNDFDSSRLPKAFKSFVIDIMKSPWFSKRENRDLAESIMKASRFGDNLNVLELALAKLIEFAIAHPPLTGDTSAKAGHLRYLQWAASGRKDEMLPSASNEQLHRCTDHSILPKLEDSDKTCARCAKKGSRVHCERCVVETEGRITLATFYCNQKCMRGHASKHKASCDTLIQFYRSMSMFAQVFPMVFEEAEDPRNIPEEISTDADGMIKVELPNFDKVQKLAFRGAPCLGPVPCKAKWDRQLFKTVLLGGSGNEVSTTMEPFLDLFFHSFVKTVEFIRVFPKNMAEAVYETKPDYVFYRTAGTHTVIRVTLSDDTRVAVDVSCAQYGWKEFMAPWERYSKHRVSSTRGKPVLEEIQTPATDAFVSEHLWNHLFARLDQRSLESQLSRDSDPKEEADQARTKLSAWMAASLSHEAKLRFGGIKAMLALEDDEAFQKACDLMMTTTKSLLDQHNSWFAGRPDFRLFLPPQGDGRLDVVRVPTAPHLCSMMERIWLTKQEADSMPRLEASIKYLRRMKDEVAKRPGLSAESRG